MAGRIESEKKKEAFLRACKDIDPLKITPDRLLQAKNLLESLNMAEIDSSMLYKSGCPIEWVSEADMLCLQENGKKLNPSYSNQCAKCWLINLTDEIEYTPNGPSIPEMIHDYHIYKNTGISPEQLIEILDLFEWNEINDFGVFIDILCDMKKKCQ